MELLPKHKTLATTDPLEWCLHEKTRFDHSQKVPHDHGMCSLELSRETDIELGH